MFTGYIFIISAAICWGLIGIFSSLAFAQGVGPMEVAFWRALLTWFLFGTQAVIQKETRMDKKDLPLFLIFGIFGISLFYISYQFAVKTAGAAFASVLLYTAPAWVVVCSYFIYKEKLTVLKSLAVALVILGVFLISKTGGNTQGSTSIGWIAILSGLASGFCYSLYYTIGKYFSGKYSSANLFLWVLPIGALGVLPFVEFSDKTPLAWTALIALSFVSTFLANFCYYKGLQYLEAGRASIVATLEPVVAAFTAYVFLGEYFTFLGYVGAGLILVAVITTIYEQ
ncbi:MAG: DMT family transporter [Proteobacteria bacterium]|nr:EamA family transporter [Desulfobacula sp.]MBU4130776.1 DMT family transporter [Pseudomonadota bacterium]